MTERKIIHIDMDAFFAAVEQRDNAELRGKPVAVGFDGPRGVVSTASYEARKYGVHSAQSIAQAKQRCPNLIIVPCRHDYYAKISHQIHPPAWSIRKQYLIRRSQEARQGEQQFQTRIQRTRTGIRRMGIKIAEKGG